LTTDVVGAALLLHLRNESVTFHFEGSDGEWQLLITKKGFNF
jgi:hypothetical protein